MDRWPGKSSRSKRFDRERRRPVPTRGFSAGGGEGILFLQERCRPQAGDAKRTPWRDGADDNKMEGNQKEIKNEYQRFGNLFMKSK